MSCTNCFNGCADIVSDQCVKYTGIDIPGLDIHTGDTLLVVENKITSKILTIIDGTGIIPILDPMDICEVVQELMPCCPPFTLNDILTVFVKSICILNDKNEGLKDRIALLEAAESALNADYIIQCLNDVTEESDTHDIVQSIIDKVCEIEVNLTQYVKISDINSYISAYIAGVPSSNNYSSKMVPYIAEAYFGPMAGAFDSTGAGIGLWDKVYLCNGQNGTPDLRGRGLVGTTTMGNTAFSPVVDPAVAGNPTYTLNSTQGSNLVYLNAAQNGPHTHSATISINDPGHIHSVVIPAYEQKADFDNNEQVPRGTKQTVQTDPAVTGLKGGDGVTVTNPPQNVFVTVGSNGQGAGHSNVQPVMAANYIMYRP